MYNTNFLACEDDEFIAQKGCNWGCNQKGCIGKDLCETLKLTNQGYCKKAWKEAPGCNSSAVGWVQDNCKLACTGCKGMPVTLFTER